MIYFDIDNQSTY